MTSMDDLELLMSVFRAEAAELADELGQQVEALAAVGGAERQDAVATALRIAHNIKGAAASVGQEQVERLAHAFESAVSHLPDGEVPADLVRAMGAAVTAMVRLAEGESCGDVAAVVAALGNDAAPASTEGLEAAGTGAAGGPASPAADPAVAGAARPEAVAPTAAREGKASVRIETKRLDRLMGYAGELLATRARLLARNERVARLQLLLAQAGERLGERAEELEGTTAALQRLVRDDRQELFAFSHLTEEMGEAMKRVRMLPLLSAGPGWRSTVREAGQELGKEVQLDIEVGEIEVDKWVLDSLRDPVMHLLRNAVDHGIEAPAERAAAGKPMVGRIAVRGSMRGSMVCIEVADDGRGLDIERIRRLALARGLVTAEQLAAMTEPEVARLLFTNGFSTAERVSHISGRGVGLDIVRRAVEQLGGSLEVGRPQRGAGTLFTMTFSVSVLSTKGLLVSTDRAVYAVPISDVSRTLRVAAGDVKLVDGTPALLLEDEQLLRVSWLAALMGEPPAPDADKLHVLVLGRGSARLGIVVKAILSEQEFVAKRLPWNLKSVDGVSGAVSMADGSVALALDVPHLFRVGAMRRENAGPGGSPARSSTRRRSILLVDDSATARILERNVLVDAGFEVVTAVHGAEAWGLLQRRSFDLVVSDVQMPEMDGLELTRRIRSSPALRHLPIVLVTGLRDAEDLARGADAGANEYIVKGELEGDKLLAAVGRLV